MGVCSTKSDGGKAAASAKTIGAKAPEDKLPKLLLLGAGGGGKSTIMKQLTLLYGPGYTEYDRQEIIPIVQSNTITGMTTLLQQAEKLNYEIVNANEAKAFMDTIQEHQEVLGPTLTPHLQSLWRDDGILQTYEHRYSFGLPDSTRYFFDRLMAISAPDYVPTDEDIIRCYARTTGIVELTVSMGETKFVVYDVGGQRAERKKWPHCFDDTLCIIYVVGTSDYDQKLVEDPEENKLVEDLKLFEGLCDMFPSKPIALLLSKTDLLREKLQSHSKQPVNTFHPTYWGDNSYDDVLKWIKQTFLSKNKFPERDVQVHTLNGTSRDEVNATFNKIKDSIARM